MRNFYPSVLYDITAKYRISILQYLIPKRYRHSIKFKRRDILFHSDRTIFTAQTRRRFRTAINTSGWTEGLRVIFIAAARYGRHRQWYATKRDDSNTFEAVGISSVNYRTTPWIAEKLADYREIPRSVANTMIVTSDFEALRIKGIEFEMIYSRFIGRELSKKFDLL